MTGDQIASVAAKYEGGLRSYPAERWPGDKPIWPPGNHDHHDGALGHVRWMCQQIPAFLKEGRVEKANRWLGFVQGVLWAIGHKSIDSMRDDNVAEVTAAAG